MTGGAPPRRLLRGTALLIGGQLLSLTVGFLLTPFMYSELGAERFGLWAVIGGVVMYFTTFDLGFGAALSRHVALYDQQGDMLAVRQLMTLGFLLYAALGLALLPVLLLFDKPIVRSLDDLPDGLQPEALHLLYWTYALAFLTLAVGTFRGFLLGIHRSEVTVAADVAGQAVYAVSLVWLLHQGLDLDAVIIASFLRLLPIVVVSLPVCTRHVRPLVTARFRKYVLMDALTFSGWMQVQSVSTAVNLQTDRVVIGSFVSVPAVAAYEFGNRIAILVRTFPLQLLGPLIPAAASQHARGNGPGLRRIYLEGTRLLSLMSLGLGGFLVAVAGPFLEVWLGEPQPVSTTLIVWLLVTVYVVNNLTGVGTAVMRAVGEPRYEAYYTLGGALLNIALTLSLTPAFGIWGVLAGTVVSTALSSLVFMGLFHRRRQVPWQPVLDSLARFLLSTATAAATTVTVIALLPGEVFASRLTGVLCLSLLAVMYSAVLTVALRLTGGVTHAEISGARSAISRALNRA